MSRKTMRESVQAWGQAMLLLVTIHPAIAPGQSIAPSPYWKNEIVFPYDSFCAMGFSRESAKWVKFTILLEPYDPNVVYFQDSRRYVFHYGFATEHLGPFVGLTTQQFNAVTLFSQDQQAILGTVILPPADGWPPQPRFNEYGIQFVRQDPYSREQIRDVFKLVEAHVAAEPDVQAFYFPTYEQQETAEAHRDWFGSQGIALGSTAQWAEGNTCYSQGWALGRLKFFAAGSVDGAYHEGLLRPEDVLLTDGIPAELPYVSGIVSLAPSTPNSHVAILAQTYGVPFVHLALTSDAERARQLAGRRVALSAYNDSFGKCDVRLIDVEESLDDALAMAILELKRPDALDLSPVAPYGAFGVSTDELQPSDIRYVGGKAAHFGILRRTLPGNSPVALALTFDLWNAFLDEPLASVPRVELAPGKHILLWADGDTAKGFPHLGFRLSRSGESIALYDRDGRTLLDVVHFGRQSADVSFGRSVDGGDVWRSFTTPTPGGPNANDPSGTAGALVINEFMADNESTIDDPCRPGQYPDWIELYNGSDETVTLNGIYLTDDVNEPTKWQVPPLPTGRTLREEIAQRFSGYETYPPNDMQALLSDLASARSLFTNAGVTHLDPDVREAVIAVLADPNRGFDPNANLRFRSSTNVEDSADFVGAGLYDSFSGCLGDDLDSDESGPCQCDPNREAERGVFQAIRRTFASFYNNNAFLERLRHDVDEREVGMALLVHHSFPDEIELANGVATIERTGPDTNTTITLVSQQGAVSVTNPEDTSIPEEVTIIILPSGSIVPPKVQRSSSLIPLGATVMEWPGEYNALGDMIVRVSDAFREVTARETHVLDLEYKKVAPGGAVLPEGGLVIKQVREIPTPEQTSNLTPFLINVPMEFEVYPGEFELLGETDVFADHRLKSRWKLETHNMPLDANSVNERLYGTVHVEYLDGDRVRTTAGQIALWPFADHRFDGESVTDSWQWRDLENGRTYHLQTTEIPTAVTPAENPLFTLATLGSYAFNLPYRCLTLDVEYERPVTSWFQQLWPGDSPSGLRVTTRNRVHLWSRPDPCPEDVLQERFFASGGVSIETSFYYPPPPTGFPDWMAHTAPLKRWGHTRIEGLTAVPIVLEGYYSRTYRPEHHNLIENFLFEPRLEPGISPAILSELDNLNIRFIHLILDNQGGGQSRIATYSFEN